MLGYLISPIAQIQDIDGKPVSGAQLFVYLADTTNAAPTFSDFEGHRNPFPVIADLLGNCTIIADSANTYDLEVRNPDGTLLMGKKNLSVSFAGEDGGQTFSPGFGIGFNTVGNTTEINVDSDIIATQEDLTAKQDKLTPGANIAIDDNRISVVGRKEVLAQYPIRMSRGNQNVKFYLDTDFIDQVSSPDISVGTDLRMDDDPDTGTKVISVDTDGTVVGNKNFIAGQGTSITGDYNIVSGIDNSVNGNSNDVSGALNSVTQGNRNRVSGYRNSVRGYSNDVSGGDNNVNASSVSCSGLSNTVEGTGNVVGGYANRVTGNHGLVVGEGLISANQHNSAVGKWNTGVDALFAVGMGTGDNARADAFRVDTDGNIFFTYNGNMEQMKPAKWTSYTWSKEVTASYNSSTGWFSTDWESFDHDWTVDNTDNGVILWSVQVSTGTNKNDPRVYYNVGLSYTTGGFNTILTQNSHLIDPISGVAAGSKMYINGSNGITRSFIPSAMRFQMLGESSAWSSSDVVTVLFTAQLLKG